ncbi:MAG: EFR1 family ferrodoxin [Actinobacteria bacterium]|nr:EFR1 family ferrodoxin [Actinomycetota bacterium]
MTADRKAYDAADLIVWSGTGNSLHVAERVAESARKAGTTARVFAAGAQVDDGFSAARLLGFLGPTHGFTAPWPLVKAAIRTPNVRGADAFVLVTRGGTRVAGRSLAGFEGTAAYIPAAILAMRGARVRGVGAIDMPLNWTVAIPAASPENAAAVIARGEAQVDAFASRVLHGESSFGGFAQLALGLLILPVSFAYMLIARLILGKMFFADERCTSCGTCAKSCPHAAVRLVGAGRIPYWTYRCHNCMRCMSKCPTQAIQGAQGWLLLYVGLISLPVAASIASAISEAIGISGAMATSFVSLLSGYLWTVAAVWAAYLVLWLGLRIPGLGFVLSRATLTRFYRLYRGPEEQPPR